MLPVVYWYSSSHICGGSDHCAWPEVTRPDVPLVTWPEVTSVTCPVRKYVLRMHNRKLRNIRPSVAFWPEVTKSRDRKRSWPEVCSAHAPFFPRVFFFLVVVTWLPDVTEGHFIPFGVPLGVRIRNRKLCNTRSSSKQCWLGVFSTTSASYNHRKPRVLYLAWLLERNIRVLYLAWLPELATHVLYLAWWLELALVICPFNFHIESRLCSTLLRVHLKISTCKMFFFIFLMFRKIKSINSMVDL
jgi:hypothetical protein